MDLIKLRGIASQKMFQHGLLGWTFDLNNDGRRLGVCKYQSQRIEIAEHYALHNSEDNVLDTLMHEIAHAIVGPGNGHGSKWKEVASRLGATPRSCDQNNNTIIKPSDWQAKCSKCGHVYHRYKRPRYLTGYRCKCNNLVEYSYTGHPAFKPSVPKTPQEAGCWQAHCPLCGLKFHRNRRPKRLTGWLCRKCSVSITVWRFVKAKGEL